MGEGYPLSEHKEKRAGERLTHCYHQYLTFHSDVLPYRISKEFQSLLELLKVQFPIIPWLREGGGGRVFRISGDGDNRMGAKTKTPKNNP